GARGVSVQDRGIEADALAAEDQDRRPRVGDVLEAALGAGGVEVWRAERRQRALERREGGPEAGRDARPVIEPGAAHLLVVEREPERRDQVQLRARRQAGAPGVAGV